MAVLIQRYQKIPNWNGTKETINPAVNDECLKYGMKYEEWHDGGNTPLLNGRRKKTFVHLNRKSIITKL